VKLQTFAQRSVNANPVDVSRALGEFEQIGLLIRRGQSLRVVPDASAHLAQF